MVIIFAGTFHTYYTYHNSMRYLHFGNFGYVVILVTPKRLTPTLTN